MNETASNIHPRVVASKATKKNLNTAIKMSLEVENEAVRLNTQTFNANRYKAISKLDDYEELKKNARKIKEESIEKLPELLEQLSNSVQANGGKVFLAKSKEDATKYIKNVCIQEKMNH